MKKVFLFSMVVVSLATQAQSKKTVTVVSSSFKPIQGTVTAEVGLTGGLNNANFGLNNNGGLLRFRYFVSDDLAVRVGFGANSNNKTNNFYGGTGGTQKGSQEIKTGGFAVNLGVEKHLIGTERLSTYVGADIIFQTTKASEKWNDFNGTVYTAGFKRELTGLNTAPAASTSGFGFRLVAGADYYIAKKLYLGAEFGFGYLGSKNKSTKDVTTITNTVTNVTTTTAVDRESSGKSSSYSPSIITGVRIGFHF